jgi:hypothetical protein
MFGLVITRMGSYGEKNAATKERQALTWQQDSNIELITLIGLTLLVTHAGHYG